MMVTRLEALQELDRRGKLPEKYREAFDEAKRRGLLGNVDNSQEKQSPKISRGQAFRTGIGQGLTFGLADELSARLRASSGAQDTPEGKALYQSTLEESGFPGPKTIAAFRAQSPVVSGLYNEALPKERQSLDAARKEYPITSLAGELVGGIGTGVGLERAGLTLASKAAKPLSRVARSIADAAIASGAYGFNAGTGDANKRSSEAAWGAATGGVLGGVGSIIGNSLARSAERKAIKRAIPTIDDLRDAKNIAYKSVDDIGAVYSPSAINSLVKDISSEAKANQLSAERHPKAFSVISDLSNLIDEPKTLTQIDQLRQVVNRDVGQAADPSERFFGQNISDKIDDFLNTAQPEQLLSADPKKAAEAINRARALNRRYRKAELIDDAGYAADISASRSGSGGNIDNAMRQRVASILLNKKKRQGFTPEEISQMEKVVKGGKGQDALRLAGKLSPQGNGLMAALTLGGSFYNSAFPIAGLAGLASKKIADSMTAKNLSKLEEIIRTGGNGLDDPLTRSLMQQKGIKMPDSERQRIIDIILRNAAKTGGYTTYNRILNQ